MMPEITNIVLQASEQTATGSPALEPDAAAAIAVGLAALAAGYAERGIGSAAMGAIAEDDSLFVNGLILTVIPETIIILALVVIFLV
ncbi:MAG: V/A-type H+-transporting ATPase subunit K [Halobacteriales archaeon]|jgi:V/A-type H+-transporting ATPase subunit K